MLFEPRGGMDLAISDVFFLKPELVVSKQKESTRSCLVEMEWNGRINDLPSARSWVIHQLWATVLSHPSSQSWSSKRLFLVPSGSWSSPSSSLSAPGSTLNLPWLKQHLGSSGGMGLQNHVVSLWFGLGMGPIRTLWFFMTFMISSFWSAKSPWPPLGSRTLCRRRKRWLPSSSSIRSPWTSNDQTLLSASWRESLYRIPNVGVAFVNYVRLKNPRMVRLSAWRLVATCQLGFRPAKDGKVRNI